MRVCWIAGAALALSASLIPAAPVAAAPVRCDHRATQRALDTLTQVHGLAGAAVAGDDRTCGRWTRASGVADLRTGRPMRADERIRIGSVTKTFTATVALQLVAPRARPAAAGPDLALLDHQLRHRRPDRREGHRAWHPPDDAVRTGRSGPALAGSQVRPRADRQSAVVRWLVVGARRDRTRRVPGLAGDRPDGRQVAFALTEVPATQQAEDDFLRAVQTALCETSDEKGTNS